MALRDIDQNAANPHKKMKLDAGLEMVKKLNGQLLNLRTETTELRQQCIAGEHLLTPEQRTTLLACNSPLPEDCQSGNELDESIIFIESDSGQDMVPTNAVNSQKVVLDEDLEIMYTRQPETISYPHPRADCALHLFTRSHDILLGPVEKNALCCDNCYCYVCDVPAKQCNEWSSTAVAHCNAHRKAEAWRNKRNSKKSGLLLKLTLEETTQEIRDAAARAQELSNEISKKYDVYREGQQSQAPRQCLCRSYERQRLDTGENCFNCQQEACNQKKVHDFSPVMYTICTAIQEAEREFSNGKSTRALVLLDDLVNCICNERPPGRSQADYDEPAEYGGYDVSAYTGRKNLMKSIDSLLVDLFMQDSVSVCIRRKVIDNMKHNLILSKGGLKWQDYISLSMRHWDNVLLSPVLHGQNITGKRGGDVLKEPLDIVNKRIAILERQKKWQQIVRYIKVVVVLTPNTFGATRNVMQERLLRSKIPLYLAYQGKFSEACGKLVHETMGEKNYNAHMNSNALLSRIEPSVFLGLLKLFSGEPTHLMQSGCSFTPLDDDTLFRLCLRAYVINKGIGLDENILKWIINRFMADVVLEPSDTAYAVLYSASWQMVADAQRGIGIARINANLIGVRLLAMNDVLSSVISKNNITDCNRILEIYKTVFKNNHWVLKDFLNQKSLEAVGVSPVLLNLLMSNHIPSYGLDGLGDKLLQRLFDKLYISQSCDILEAVLKHSRDKAATSDRNDYLYVLENTQKILFKYGTQIIAKKVSCAYSTESGDFLTPQSVTRLLKLIAPLQHMCSNIQRYNLTVFALNRFETQPSVDSLVDLQIVSGYSWPTYKAKCLKFMELPWNFKFGCDKTCMVDVLFMLDGHRQAVKYLSEDSTCREACGALTVKSNMPFSRLPAPLIKNITRLLTAGKKTVTNSFLHSSKNWLIEEAYRPILCKGCGHQIHPELVDCWCTIGTINPEFLVLILKTACQKISTPLSSFPVISNEQKKCLVSWLLQIKSTLQQLNQLYHFKQIIIGFECLQVWKKTAIKRVIMENFSAVLMMNDPIYSQPSSVKESLEHGKNPSWNLSEANLQEVRPAQDNTSIGITQNVDQQSCFNSRETSQECSAVNNGIGNHSTDHQSYFANDNQQNITARQLQERVINSNRHPVPQAYYANDAQRNNAVWLPQDCVSNSNHYMGAYPNFPNYTPEHHRGQQFQENVPYVNSRPMQHSFLFDAQPLNGKQQFQKSIPNNNNARLNIRGKPPPYPSNVGIHHACSTLNPNFQNLQPLFVDVSTNNCNRPAIIPQTNAYRPQYMLNQNNSNNPTSVQRSDTGSQPVQSCQNIEQSFYMPFANSFQAMNNLPKLIMHNQSKSISSKGSVIQAATNDSSRTIGFSQQNLSSVSSSVTLMSLLKPATTVQMPSMPLSHAATYNPPGMSVSTPTSTILSSSLVKPVTTVQMSDMPLLPAAAVNTPASISGSSSAIMSVSGMSVLRPTSSIQSYLVRSVSTDKVSDMPLAPAASILAPNSVSGSPGIMSLSGMPVSRPSSSIQSSPLVKPVTIDSSRTIGFSQKNLSLVSSSVTLMSLLKPATTVQMPSMPVSHDATYNPPVMSCMAVSRPTSPIQPNLVKPVTTVQMSDMPLPPAASVNTPASISGSSPAIMSVSGMSVSRPTSSIQSYLVRPVSTDKVSDMPLAPAASILTPNSVSGSPGIMSLSGMPVSRLSSSIQSYLVRPMSTAKVSAIPLAPAALVNTPASISVSKPTSSLQSSPLVKPVTTAQMSDMPLAPAASINTPSPASGSPGIVSSVSLSSPTASIQCSPLVKSEIPDTIITGTPLLKPDASLHTQDLVSDMTLLTPAVSTKSVPSRRSDSVHSSSSATHFAQRSSSTRKTLVAPHASAKKKRKTRSPKAITNKAALAKSRSSKSKRVLKSAKSSTNHCVVFAVRRGKICYPVLDRVRCVVPRRIMIPKDFVQNKYPTVALRG